jgi:hypothetical protein
MNERNKILTNQYKTDFATLRELVNSFDPWSLIEGGAPKDEYDDLTQELLSFIYNNKSKNEIQSLILKYIEPLLSTEKEYYGEKFIHRTNVFINEILNKIEPPK